MGWLNFIRHKKREEIEPYDIAEELAETIIDALTAGEMEEDKYQSLREELLKDELIAQHAPEFVRKYTSLMDIFNYVKSEFKEYKRRKKFVEKEFKPFLKFLKKADMEDIKCRIIIDEVYIRKTWKKAQKLISKNPKEALELVYILLEDTARYILDDMELEYPEDEKMKPLLLLESVMDHVQFSKDPVLEQNFKRGFLFLGQVIEQMDVIKEQIEEETEEFKLDVEMVVNIIGTSCLYLYRKYQIIKARRLHVENE